MRIQHNIMAMSAYRNYNTNTSAVAKNLEKLSSGYKINRAGDDAAGLAISEKMRAQITGLNAAQKNVKDGISLVKTAEGAMQEIQDMLNRMDYLATQSANGTYQDEVDREALQKEVNQLCDEINRIADSANFNGIKLLDGSLDTTSSETVKDPTIVGEGEFTKYGNRMQGANVDDPTLHKDATGSSKTSFEFDLNGKTMKADENGEATFAIAMARQPSMEAVYFKEITLTGLEKDKEYSAADLASLIQEKMGDTVELNYTTDQVSMAANSTTGGPLVITDNTANSQDTDTKIEYKVTAEGGKLKFEMTDDGHKDALAAVAGANPATAPAHDADPLQGNFTIGIYTGYTKTDNNTDPDSKGTLTGTADIGSSNIHVGSKDNGEQLAETVIDAYDVFGDGTDGCAVKDGSGFIIGNETYVIAATDKTANAKYGDGVKVVDIRDLVKDDNGTLKFKNDADLKTEFGGDMSASTRVISRITEAAKDNKMWNVQQAYGHNQLVLTEKKGQKEADLTTKQNIKDTIHKFTSITANVETKAASGKALQLQIGDTSEEFNQLKVSVGDMHTKALGIDGLNIGNAESAAKAIATIKDAINNVSSVRGDLGAYQNRLEHTANNLSVMAENIQDAESSIRDTDIAEEMMSYTKNNILVQSAQAMLAQANQVPQGVLQLLG